MNDKITPRELAKRIERGEKWKLADPDELAGLPEDVREAVVAIDTGNGVFVDRDDGIGGEKWHTVRAELLRMARENAELRDSNSVLTSANEMDFQARRRAESELAALKRRIAEAVTVENFRRYSYGHEFIKFSGTDESEVTDCSLWGKRVALLPVGGDRDR